jgi:hypothetical protein
MLALLRKITVTVILVVWLFPGASPAAAEADSRQLTAFSRSARAAGGATSAEIKELAERERQAGALERFEGGGRISISTSALIIILLLVIILIILL